MATNFPTGVDNFPTHTDNNNEPVRASDVNNIQDGLKATQQEVLDIKENNSIINLVQTATGTANAITITTGGSFDLTQGNKLSFKTVADNTTNVTINVDGTGVKPLLKLDGNQIPASGLKNGKVYDVYYDTSSGGRFFLLARATGDAVAANVLASKTFSNETDSGLTGTMPNNGAVTITPSTSNQTIALGYHNGSGIIQGDADLVASNIRDGVNIFGVLGNVIEGKRWATGTLTLAGSSGTPNVATINNLTFVPKLIIVGTTSTSNYATPNIWAYARIMNYDGTSISYRKLDNNGGVMLSATEPTTTSFTIQSSYADGYTHYIRWWAFEQYV